MTVAGSNHQGRFERASSSLGFPLAIPLGCVHLIPAACMSDMSSYVANYRKIHSANPNFTYLHLHDFPFFNVITKYISLCVSLFRIFTDSAFVFLCLSRKTCVIIPFHVFHSRCLLWWEPAKALKKFYLIHVRTYCNTIAKHLRFDSLHFQEFAISLWK